ncbi:uncharacterized protein [Argopecten irradians]|uniref:uncharacterized protein n=1 Tax=Argopecten irradians TaxID=31199 RepID=UPI00371381E4
MRIHHRRRFISLHMFELYSSDDIPVGNKTLSEDEESETSNLADIADEFEQVDVSEIYDDEENVRLKVTTFQDRVMDVIIKEAGARAEKTEELEFFVEKNSKEANAFREKARRVNWLLRKQNRRLSILLCSTILLTVSVVIVMVILLALGVLG